MITTKEKGDKYELWVYRIIGKIIDDVGEKFTKQHNISRWGYQIDILCESNRSRIIVECKDWGKKIQHGTIDQFSRKVSRIKDRVGDKKNLYAIFISSSFFYDNVIKEIYDGGFITTNEGNIFNTRNSLDIYRIAPIKFEDNIILYDYSIDGIKLKSLNLSEFASHSGFDEYYGKILSINSTLDERVTSGLKILSDYKTSNKISLITYENLGNTLYHLGHYNDAYQIAKIMESNVNRFRVSTSDKIFFGTEGLLVQALAYHSNAKKRDNQNRPGEDAFRKLFNHANSDSKSITAFQMTPINIFIGEWLVRYANPEKGLEYLRKGKELAANTGNDYMLFTALRKLSQVSRRKSEKERYIIEAKDVAKNLKGNFLTLANEFINHERDKFRK